MEVYERPPEITVYEGRSSESIKGTATAELGRVLGQDRRPKVERAMGIEPTGKALAELENKRFRVSANPKCD